jgi:steroid delta-isomerase-like uncharacterized protein
MATKSKTLLHEWFEEVWNKQNAAMIDKLASVDAVAHGLVDEQGNELRGIKAFKEFHHGFIQAFPDLRVEVVDTISEGDKTVARCIVRGTHQGDGLGFPATGRKIEFTGACIARISNGQIVEAWNDFDFLTMHRQLDTLKLLGQANFLSSDSGSC